MLVDRNEAVAYLKELLRLCDELSPESVFFENPKTGNAVGYRVHIKGTIHESDRQTVRELAKKRSLEVQEETGGVVIYRPR